jgi:hypothetical protein
MNNANRVVNPRQSVDPRDPRSGGFGDRFADRRADRQDRRGQLINEYLNYDPTPPNLSIDPAFDIQQQRRLNKGKRMYETDRKRAARDEERDLIKEANKRDRLLKKEARVNRRGSKAYGGEQYYGAGGPFSHIPMQDYGMGGWL